MDKKLIILTEKDSEAIDKKKAKTAGLSLGDYRSRRELEDQRVYEQAVYYGRTAQEWQAEFGAMTVEEAITQGLV